MKGELTGKPKAVAALQTYVIVGITMGESLYSLLLDCLLQHSIGYYNNIHTIFS